MKPNRFTLTAAALASLMWLASCTHEVDEASDYQTNAIGFNSTIFKQSRALNSFEDLNKFFVYGTKDGSDHLFLGQPVSKSGDDWTYTYTGGKSKPKWEAGSRYIFFAYSSENSTLAGSVSYDATNGLTFSGVTSGSEDNNADLVYASRIEQVGLQTGNSRVPFSFKHILSQINVVFTNSTTNSENVPYNVTVNSVSLNNHELVGDFNGSAWSIANTSIAGDHVPFTFGTSTGSSAIALSQTATTSPLFVIPQTTGDVTILYNVTITNANNSADTTTKTWKATFDASWLMGYRYNYNIPVALTSDEYIEFTVSSLNGWEDGTTGQINSKK